MQVNGCTQAQDLAEDPIHGTGSPLLESEATPEALEPMSPVQLECSGSLLGPQ